MPMFKPIRNPGALGGYLPQGMRPPAQPLWQAMSQAPAPSVVPPPVVTNPVPISTPGPANNPFAASAQNYFSNPAQWNAGVGQAMSPMAGQQIRPGVPPVGFVDPWQSAVGGGLPVPQQRGAISGVLPQRVPLRRF